MGISFSYTVPDINPAKGAQPGTYRLNLRHDPYNVEWSYNVNTAQYDTYGGQVIQVLSVNIDQLVIEGQLGREGAFGVKKAAIKTRDPRWGGQVSRGGFVTRDTAEQFDYNGVAYPGLHAMVEFFREYFARASQGGDSQAPGQYLQIPMTLTYGAGPFAEGTRQWSVTPVNFPSFKRSNANFAPEWRIECQVVQADRSIATIEKQAAIARLQQAIGWKAKNPWSDPLADPSTSTSDITSRIVSQFRNLLPKFTEGDLENMIWENISVPNATGQTGAIDPALTTGKVTQDLLQGEVGFHPGPN